MGKYTGSPSKGTKPLFLALILSALISPFLLCRLVAPPPSDGVIASTSLPTIPSLIPASETPYFITLTSTKTSTPTSTIVLTDTNTPTFFPPETLIKPPTPTGFIIEAWHNESPDCRKRGVTDETIKIIGVTINGGVPPYKIVFEQYGETQIRYSTENNKVEFSNPVLLSRKRPINVKISFRNQNNLEIVLIDYFLHYETIAKECQR